MTESTGGRLLLLYDGELRTMVREEGEATIHPSTVLHAVTCMTAGVRYSLIIFCQLPAASGARGSSWMLVRRVGQYVEPLSVTSPTSNLRVSALSLKCTHIGKDTCVCVCVITRRLL